MKKKILIHFKSDKFFRVFYYSQLKKKLEKKYNVFFFMDSKSRFNHLVPNKKKILYQKNLKINLILKYPLKYICYVFLEFLISFFLIT